MVGVIHNYQFVFSGERRNNFLDFLSRAKFIIGPVNEQLRFGAIRQKRKIAAVHRDADPDQFADARIAAADSKAHETPKAETRKQEWNARKLCSKVIERRLHIALLTAPVVVRAAAQACTAKIEPEHRDSQGIQSFGRVINHFVVHGPTKERVGMANHRSQQGGSGLNGSPENRLQASGWPPQEEIL